VTETLDVNGPVLAAPLRSAPLAPARELYTGRPAISVQCETTAPALLSAAGICVESQLGAVLTFAARYPVRSSMIGDVLETFGGVTGDVQHVLIDANRYAGTCRTIGASTLDLDWVDAQLRAGLRYALTDSPYIPEGDTAALVGVLAQTRAMRRPVIAALPINYLWLKNHATQLREAINRGGVPVALMVEHKRDPMGGQAVVRGLVHVLGAEQPVLALRCDASAIPAVPYGASGGAIGTLSGLRHLYPLPTGTGGRPPNARISVWVPRLMAYISVEKVADLVQHPDIAHYFVCECTVCNGQTLDRITTDPQAYEHSIRALADFATRRIGVAVTPELQRLAFDSAVRIAQFAHLEIEERTGVPMNPPDFLGAWAVAYRESLA
ncbi:MAG: hypothetical protein HGA44_08075, partial [Cellulomonadaceae bacterium]|nr:hypothetical protein [Cellulomonadaceae bacterium]